MGIALVALLSLPMSTSGPANTAASSPVSAVAVSPGSGVWVAVEDARRLVKVDTSARRVVRRASVPGNPHNIAVSHRGVVVATLQPQGSIAILRNGKVREVELGGSPHDVKIVRGMAIVANEGAARLDRVTLKGRIWRSIPLKANPHDLAIAPSKRKAWVTLDGTDDVAIVDLKRKKVRRYLSTGHSPHDVLFASDGRAWITDWNHGIHVYSRRGRLLKTFDRGSEPHHLAFSPDGTKGWITDHGSRRLIVISLRTLKVVRVARSRGLPHHVAVTSSGRRVAVADHEGGRLVLFNAKTKRHIGFVAVGAGPHGVWARP